MKTVEAFWEKRNLGIDVFEITCSEQDTCKQLEDEIKNLCVPYSVIKIPSGCTDLLLVAQNYGYIVAEMGIELWGNERCLHTPEIYNRFTKFLRMEKAEGLILDRVLNEIKLGDIFSTDRIALDPVFSKELAGVRYYNWTKDVLAEDGDIYVFYYKDQPVAFNLSKPLKDNKDIIDGILGGLLPEAENKGLGFLVVYGENEIRKFNNAKACIGRVSSNNLPILRLHLQFGYEVKSMSYVLTKHC